jgi:hypothetical protein
MPTPAEVFQEKKFQSFQNRCAMEEKWSKERRESKPAEKEARHLEFVRGEVLRTIAENHYIRLELAQPAKHSDLYAERSGSHSERVLFLKEKLDSNEVLLEQEAQQGPFSREQITAEEERFALAQGAPELASKLQNAANLRDGLAHLRFVNGEQTGTLQEVAKSKTEICHRCGESILVGVGSHRRYSKDICVVSIDLCRKSGRDAFWFLENGVTVAELQEAGIAVPADLLP